MPYISPVDNSPHRYFVDFKVQIRENDGSHKTYLVEIKPEAQTKPPVKNRNKKRYLSEAVTYATNEAKWKAARRYAEERGWKFIILTEQDLGLR